MSLLTQWREHAYSLDDRTPEGKEFWLDYFQREKAIYEKILEILHCDVSEIRLQICNTALHRFCCL